MKLAIGKIGTTISFSKKRQTNSKSAIYEVTNTLIFLAKRFPKWTFYIISRSDFDRLTKEELSSFFPNKNVINLVHCDFSFEDIPVCDADAALVFAGPSSGVNRSNYFMKDGKVTKSLQCFNNYSAPAYWIINKNNMHWIYLGLDPRYINKNIQNCSDMLIPPSYVGVLYTPKNKVLKVYNDKLITKNGKKRILDYEVPIENCYQYVLNLDRTISNVGNHNKYMLSLHNDNSAGGKNITNRFELNKKYFFNSKFCVNKVDLAGDWSKSEKNIPESEKHLFIGGIKPNELYSFLGNYRYAVLYSMYKGMSSGKWFEMLASGVIPFLIEDYDSSCDFLPENHFLRVNSSKELIEKCKKLDKKSKQDIEIITKKLLYNSINKLEHKFLEFLKKAIRKCKNRLMFLFNIRI